jgi:uncharacterized protein (DUF1330 family)
VPGSADGRPAARAAPHGDTIDAGAIQSRRKKHMAKAYWVSWYYEISDPDKLAAYAKLAGPAIEAAGGRFIARAPAAQAYEGAGKERTTIIEFPTVEQAIAAHDSSAYRAALEVLDGGAVRAIRILPGV